jgi:hypothetical protein
MPVLRDQTLNRHPGSAAMTLNFSAGSVSWR